MAATIEESIQSINEDEVRFRAAVNDLGTYTTRGGVQTPTIRQAVENINALDPIAAAQSAQQYADAAAATANVYATISAGMAATATNGFFNVTPNTTDGLDRLSMFQKTGTSTYTLVFEHLSAAELDAIIGETFSDTVSFSVVDGSGRRSWVEVDQATGGPTDHALKILNANNPVQDSVDDPSFSVVDDAGRRSWVEVAQATGGPTEHAAQKIADAIEPLFASIIPTQYDDPTGTVSPKIVSGPDIVCWGDSMTAGAGGGGTTYPGVLATLTGRTVHNAGVGGETSVSICARSGATPYICNVSGGVIPASGGVTITFEPINGQVPAPLLQNIAQETPRMPGSLAGVPGTISYSGPTPINDGSGVYTFTRTTAGSAVTADRPTPYYTDWSWDRRNDVWIIWIGQNGPSETRAHTDAAAMIQHMQALEKRFLVIPKPTSTDADDSAWFELYGRRVVMARKYLVDYGLEDAGITPTAQDLTDISNGVVPTSLRYDAVHWTADGYTILANLIHKRMQELRWI